MSRIVVIVNPESGRGAGTRHLPRLTAPFAEHGVTDICTTTAPDDEARVVGEAVRAAAATLTFDTPPRYELNGDLHQAQGTVVQVGLIPRVVRVLVG